MQRGPCPRPFRAAPAQALRARRVPSCALLPPLDERRPSGGANSTTIAELRAYANVRAPGFQLVALDVAAGEREQAVPRRSFMRWRRSALRFGPVVADADVHRERRVEVVGAAHLGADEIAYLRHLHVGHLEQQLVV